MVYIIRSHLTLFHQQSYYHHHLHPSSESKRIIPFRLRKIFSPVRLLAMDTSSSAISSSPSSSSSSSSINVDSSCFGSSGLEADAGPSFPYTPSSSLGRQWRGSHRETPRFFCEPISGAGDAHHFLDACFLCKKPIAANDNIFMYRGNSPFCSEECREEQMEMDEALENNRKEYSFSSSSSSSFKDSSSSVSPTIKRRPSLIIRPNSRNVHGVVAGY